MILKSFRKDCGEACKQASAVDFRLTALLRALHPITPLADAYGNFIENPCKPYLKKIS